MVDGFGQIGPGLRHRQLLGLDVAGVPHDAVARRGKALVIALGVVDREGAHLLGNALDLDLVLLQQAVPLEHLEGVGRGGPEHVGPVVPGGLLQILDAGRRTLPQHLDLDPGVLFLEGGLDGGGGVRRVGCYDNELVLDRAGAERCCRHGQCQDRCQDAESLSRDNHGLCSSWFKFFASLQLRAGDRAGATESPPRTDYVGEMLHCQSRFEGLVQEPESPQCPVPQIL